MPYILLMDLIFHNIAIWIESSKYVLLFIGTIFEGPVVMMTSGVLYKFGQFNFWPMYIALVSGDFLADIGWYCLGRFGTRKLIFKFGHIVGLTPTILEKVQDRFNKYHQKILILSKLTMGLGFGAIVLLVAGMSKVPFKSYVILNLIGGFIWTALLLTIGYIFGNIYVMVPPVLKVTLIALVILAIFIVMKMAKRYFVSETI